MSAERFSFVIDRERWQRGTPDEGILLSHDTGKMCCLGFFLLACGVPEDSIRGLGEPQEPFVQGPEANDPDAVPKVAGFLVDVEPIDDLEGAWEKYSISCSDAGAKLMGANDDAALPEPVREAEIAKLFAARGIDVAFVDRCTDSICVAGGRDGG